MALATKTRIIFVMAANEEEASMIARTLVEEQLAACVNIISPVRSIYRWQAKIEESGECLLLIKTSTRNYARLERRVKDLHSYDVPEIIAMTLAHGSSDYLKWIAESTGEPAASMKKPLARRRSPRSA